MVEFVREYTTTSLDAEYLGRTCVYGRRRDIVVERKRSPQFGIITGWRSRRLSCLYINVEDVSTNCRLMIKLSSIDSVLNDKSKEL